METRDHPRKADGADYVLAFNFADRKSVRLIFHCGSRRKETKHAPPIREDVTGQIDWQSDIRAVAIIRNAYDPAHVRPLRAGLIGDWISAVAQSQTQPQGNVLTCSRIEKVCMAMAPSSRRSR